ncbi:MAG: F0F1 ATP synthase subunit delta [Planctomycetota bacterium]|nr:F0F1 ATP synthase subunit delta [Planctomycetota bacterium]MDI6787856.1 F0F1 ATP synthase subunit delta [Planctomycetota bacterium]
MGLKDALMLAGGFIVFSAILALILRAVLSGQSNAAIERLKRINQENLQREMELKKKLEEAEIQYQKRLTDAGEEVKKLKTEMEEDIAELKNRIIAVAEKEKEDIITDAHQEVEDLKTTLTRSFQSRTLETAQMVITKTLVSEDNKKLSHIIHRYFIETAISKIRASGTLLIPALKQEGGGEKEIEVYPAFELSPEDKQTFSEVFSEIAERKISIVEKPVQNRHLAGVLIKVGNLLIDATLSARLKEVIG